MTATPMEILASRLREETIPFYSDDELQALLDEHGGNVDTATYYAAVRKAEDTALSFSGLTVADTSKYFLRIARLYRPSNSGTLKGI